MNRAQPLRLHFTRAFPLFAATLFAAMGTSSHAGAETRAPARRMAVASLPTPLQAMLSATLGNDDLAYRVSFDGLRYRMINARQGLKATVGPHGYSVRAGSGEWRLRLTGWGRGESRRETATGAATAPLNRVEIGRSGLLEWWVNGPLGLENGWTVTEPPQPASRKPLTLVLAQSGNLRARLGADERTLAVTNGAGRQVLRYAGLAASDAGGRELPARFEVAGKNLCVHVDDLGATYPIRIDPWVQAATLTASDGAANDLRVSPSR